MCSNKRAVDLCDQVAHSPPPANVLRFFFRTIVSRFLFKLLPKVTPHLLLTAYSWINKSSCVCVLLWDSLSQTHSVCLRPFSSFYFTTTKWIELVKTITRLGVFQSNKQLDAATKNKIFVALCIDFFLALPPPLQQQQRASSRIQTTAGIVNCLLDGLVFTRLCVRI